MKITKSSKDVSISLAEKYLLSYSYSYFLILILFPRNTDFPSCYNTISDFSEQRLVQCKTNASQTNSMEMIPKITGCVSEKYVRPL